MTEDQMKAYYEEKAEQLAQEVIDAGADPALVDAILGRMSEIFESRVRIPGFHDA